MRLMRYKIAALEYGNDVIPFLFGSRHKVE
jgi:hypothetical protein